MQATNDTMASIGDSIKEGDKIVLNLRDHLSLMDLPSIVEEDNSDMRALRYQKQPAITKKQVPEKVDRKPVAAKRKNAAAGESG